MSGYFRVSSCKVALAAQQVVVNEAKLSLALAVILTLWSMVLYFRAFLTTLEEEAESSDG